MASTAQALGAALGSVKLELQRAKRRAFSFCRPTNTLTLHHEGHNKTGIGHLAGIPWPRIGLACLVAAGVAGGVAACTERPHPPSYQPPANEPGISTQSTCSASQPSPPAPDAQGLCGNQVLPAAGPAPTIYFVLDRSGSMADLENGEQKYTTLNRAVVKLVRSLGNRARFGAAVFPSWVEDDTNQTGCGPGAEVFAPTLGDSPLRESCSEIDGPVTKRFAFATATPGGMSPSGGTPVAATLDRLRAMLTTLPGKTVLVLATDGAPNCNPAQACDAGHCIANLEKAAYCDASANCCEPSAYGPESCLDEAVIGALSTLSACGISTYVIGMPGSGPYADLLNRAAHAGGHARPTGSAYYDVRSLSELDATLVSIGASALLSCHLKLDQFPPDPGYVNVYLDQKLVPQGGRDGWQWSATSATSQEEGPGGELPDAGDAAPATAGLEIDLMGVPCEELTSGRVQRVQVIAGCATERAR
jgi:hypothetical protein